MRPRRLPDPLVAKWIAKPQYPKEDQIRHAPWAGRPIRSSKPFSLGSIPRRGATHESGLRSLCEDVCSPANARCRMGDSYIRGLYAHPPSMGAHRIGGVRRRISGIRCRASGATAPPRRDRETGKDLRITADVED